MVGSIVYDRNGRVFRVGDIVTTYYKGYHRVISYNSGVLKFEAVLSDKMTKTAKTIRECSVDWCHLANKEKMVAQLRTSLELVETIFGGQKWA